MEDTMRNRLATAAAWGLVCLMGLTASAQTSNQGNASDSQKGDSKQQQQKGDSKQQKDASPAQGQTEKVRGELAAVSVVGETMVDYSTGRGVVAEFTYLTILGSPSDGGRQGGSGGQADSDRNASNSNKNSSSKDDHSGSDKKDQGQGSNQGQADKDQGNQGRSGGGAMNRRRSVYQIAVGPDTQVRSRNSQGGGNSGDQKDGQQGSARDQSRAHLERLQLGDRVEVEFTRMSSPSQSGAGGDQGGSASQARHGRNRLIRGVAKSVTILSAPDQQGGDKSAENRKDGDSSSEKHESGSGSKEKKSDQKD